MDLPVVFEEDVEVFVPEVIGADVGDGVGNLGEVVVVASAVDLVDVLDPVGEVELGGAGVVAEAAVALEEVGDLLVDEVDVDTDLGRVLAAGGGVDVGDLPAVLVGEGAAWEGAGFAVGEEVGERDGGAAGVGAGGLKIARPLEVDDVGRG